MIVNRLRLTVKSKLLYAFQNCFKSCDCPNKPPKCEPKNPCDAYKPCPPPPCAIPPLKCIPDCSQGGGHEGSVQLYRNISLFLVIPTLILTAIYVYMKVEEEESKPRQEFVPYSYMYLRTKRFPWGDGNHSFIHNPVKNAIPPGGYETEDPNAAVKKTDEEE